jgi:C-terminal region of eIF3h
MLGIYFHCLQSPARLTAFRLSDKFMATNLKNITGKVCKDLGLSFGEIFETIPIVVKNSFILQALNIQIMTDLVEADLIPVQKTIETQLEELIEAVEDQGQEYWRWQAWHRTFQKELKQSKSGGDSTSPTTGGAGGETASSPQTMTPTPALNKVMAAEPGRLETLLLAYEIDKHAKELVQFAV